jgi:hypothetical protein
VLHGFEPTGMQKQPPLWDESNTAPHWSPGSHAPSQVGNPLPPAQGMLGKVVLVVVLVDVVVVTQPPTPHASQQLAKVDVHAVPPAGGRQVPLRLMLQRVIPCRVRQQVTNPGRPQTDFAAHRLTAPTHSARSMPVPTLCRATSVAQRTYVP